MRTARKVIAALLAVGTLAAAAVPAQAQWNRPGWGPGPGPGWGPGPGYGPPPGYYNRNCGWGGCNNNAGAAAAAGLVGGLILGAAAASAANQARQPQVYYAPGPAADPNWISYCSAKYRSFDPRTGTYLGYDGVRHPCQ